MGKHGEIGYDYMDQVWLCRCGDGYESEEKLKEHIKERKQYV